MTKKYDYYAKFHPLTKLMINFISLLIISVTFNAINDLAHLHVQTVVIVMLGVTTHMSIMNRVRIDELEKKVFHEVD